MNSTDEEFRNSPTFTTTRKQRTKRQRTTSIVAGGGCADNNSSSSSAATPKSTTYNDSDQDEEDVASCLILLANGVVHNKSKTPKISNGVYECKTCNKTFPSFQALGGHRTSHKKLLVVDNSSSPIINSDNIHISRVLDDKTTTRVHECSICGSEFPSGQALGGHMRRHRPIGITPPSPTEVKNGVLELDLNLPALPEDDNSHMVIETKFHVLPTPPLLLDCHY